MTMMTMMTIDDHDDHDDHSDEEDDHDDHSDEEDDHDDGGGEIVADDDEEAFDYDPHSWLDPISFNEQLNLVLEKMITVFPDATDVFTANAETYSASLTQLDSNFEAKIRRGWKLCDRWVRQNYRS